MTNDASLDVMGRVPLFERLSRADLTAISGLLTLRTYDAGDWIVGEGQAARPTVLLRGAARLLQGPQDGRFVGLGFVGEGALIGPLPFGTCGLPEQAQALCRCRAATVELRDLERLGVAVPALSHALLHELQLRAERSSQRLQSVAWASVPARLATALLELAEELGRVTPTGVRIDVRLTHSQLAEHAATARETASKIVSWLQREGLASVERNVIWLHDVERLELVRDGVLEMRRRGASGLTADAVEPEAVVA
jgi:CRP/FNR family transcriptional regulator